LTRTAIAGQPRIERAGWHCFDDIMTQHLLSFAPAPAHSGQRLVEAVAKLGRILNEWRSRARGRREIAKLDHHAARDLGISLSQLQFEAQKPFWRA
jgi:uncharacterized protein YjiS (DUF1127 family)